MKVIFYIIYESTRLLTKESEQHRVATAAFALFCIGLIGYSNAIIITFDLFPREMGKGAFILLGLSFLILACFLLERRYMSGNEVSRTVLLFRKTTKYKPWQLHFISLVYNAGGIVLPLLAGIYH